MIPLRRHPVLAISIPSLGIVLTLIGLYFESIWLITPGIMAIILGALMIVNPVLVVEPASIRLLNLFGIERASFSHDGLEHLEILEGKLFIQYENQRAHLKSVDPKVLHQGDWQNLQRQLAKARQITLKKKRPSS